MSEETLDEVCTKFHTHVDERGHIVKCWHECRSLVTDWKFWAGMTLGFPFEHYLYEKVYPFTLVTKALGL